MVKDGSRAGEYANLDFKMLVDLSIVDMLLRYEMLPLTLDIEHFAKVQLLGQAEGAGEDGYAVVTDFLTTFDEPRAGGLVSNRVKQEIEGGRSSSYVADLLKRYPDHDYPIWAFLEVITFGTFLRLYRFCGERFDSKQMHDGFYLLQGVKSLRNACAHNNCILNNLVSGAAHHNVQPAVSQALTQVDGLGKSARRSRMGNDRIQQIATTLYVHRELASDGVRGHRAQSLHEFRARMDRHIDYYKDNFQVSSTFDFLGKVIGAWYPV